MIFFHSSLITFLAFFTFSNCSTHTPYSTNVDHVFGELNRELKKEGKLRIFGSGSSVEGGIEHWQFDYRYKGIFNITEVRRMYIPLVERAINKVNNEKKMQPFLSARPFDWRHIQIGILFSDHNDDLAKAPNIAFVTRINNNIYYFLNHGDDTPFENIYSEPYEEALRIFREEQRLQNAKEPAES